MRLLAAEEELLKRKITVVMRAEAQAEALNVASALSQGGLTSFEITFESPGAREIIGLLKAQKRGYLVGAGTVRKLADAEAALQAGADFSFCPHFDPELVQFGAAHDHLLIPGIFTATELMAAVRAGARVVKLFPASLVGPGYLKALRGPFPELRCIPTGGISAANLGEYVKAGAVGLGMGGSLVNKAAIARGDWETLREEAEKVVQAAAEAGWPVA